MKFRLVLIFVMLLTACGGSGGGGRNPSLIGLSGITATYDTSESAYRELLDAATEAGVSLLQFQLATWNETETAPDVFDFSQYDAFFGLIGQHNIQIVLDVATPLAVGGPNLPTDLTFTSFDDEELIERYKAYLDAVIARFGSVSHITLHTEGAASYFADKPDSFETFCDLLDLAINHIHSLSPETKVGIYGNADEPAENLEKMNRSTDMFGISYLAARGDDNHAVVLQRLIDLAGSKPIALIEVGVPTALSQGGSEQKQVDFVNFIFDTAVGLGNRLDYMSYYQVFDEDPTVTRQYVPILFPDLSPESQFNLIEFLTSLGLHRSDKSPKPAWERFKERNTNFLELE